MTVSAYYFYFLLKERDCFPSIYIKSETDIKEEPLDIEEEDTGDDQLFEQISELGQNEKHSKILPKVSMDKIFRHVTIKTDDGKCVDLILDEEAYKKFLEDDDYAKQLFSKHYDSNAEQKSSSGERKEKEVSKAGLSLWNHNMIMLLLNSILKEKKHYMNKFTRNAAFSAAHREFLNHNYQNISLDDIKRKWYNMQPTYRKIKDKLKVAGEENPTWPYFDIIDEILRYEKSENVSPQDKTYVDTCKENSSVSEVESKEETMQSTTTEKPKKLRNEPSDETREEIQSTSEKPRKRRKLGSDLDFQEYADESTHLLQQVCVNINEMGKGITTAIEEQTKAIKDLTVAVTNYVQFLKQSHTHT
ncbi:hypothetical protein Anas_05926 [Armadillidium nasatum]|uniref:Myb/SANT-like DNA-binding domain-containing protein n=1 Tax=Armadillidium nasatum TaxID=96803 RepID=A0A5N5TPA2_9CRUS|nr:hypothetical protein Anas_05926 [Armadillidium nasatum]